jgi:hypothetical protein
LRVSIEIRATLNDSNKTLLAYSNGLRVPEIASQEREMSKLQLGVLAMAEVDACSNAVDKRTSVLYLWLPSYS